MKKVATIATIMAAMMLALSTTVLAGVKIKPKQLTTQEIDSLYKYAPYMVNCLEVEKQVICYDGDARIKLFSGQADDNVVNMCMIEMPRIMDSQAVSLQVVVNGSQQFFAPLRLSYQVYDTPKYIGGLIIIRAYVGMYSPNPSHFYIVLYANGNGYATEVV